MSLLLPLYRIADIILDEIIFPIDGKRCVAVNCHVQLPSSHTCKDKCIIPVIKKNKQFDWYAWKNRYLFLQMNPSYDLFRKKLDANEMKTVFSSPCYSSMNVSTHWARLLAVVLRGSELGRHSHCWRRWCWGDMQSRRESVWSPAEWCWSAHTGPLLMLYQWSRGSHHAAL